MTSLTYRPHRVFRLWGWRVCLRTPAAAPRQPSVHTGAHTQPLLTCLSLDSWWTLGSWGAWKGEGIQNVACTKEERKDYGVYRQRQVSAAPSRPGPPSPLVALADGGGEGPFGPGRLEEKGQRHQCPNQQGGGNATHTIIHLTSVTEHRGPAKLCGRDTRKDRAPSSKELMAQQAKHSRADGDSRGRLSSSGSSAT